jgi:cytidine deaminase
MAETLPNPTSELIAALRTSADEARMRAYAPYSNFIVLAAVSTPVGVFGGANVEAANYTLVKHAEEAAILAAISGGAGPQGPWLQTLYVAGATPCGSCRQFAYEFGGLTTLCLIDDVDQLTLGSPNTRLADLPQPPRAFPLGYLLPEAFGPRDVLKLNPADPHEVSLPS